MQADAAQLRFPHQVSHSNAGEDLVDSEQNLQNTHWCTFIDDERYSAVR